MTFYRTDQQDRALFADINFALPVRVIETVEVIRIERRVGIIRIVLAAWPQPPWAERSHSAMSDKGQSVNLRL